MSERTRARLVAFGIAALVPAVILPVIRRLVDEHVLGDRVVYMAFLPAVLVAAYLGGFWPGLLATVVSAVGATYFLIEPVGTFAFSSRADADGLALFVLIGTLVSGLIEALHRSRRRVAASERRYAVTLASIGDAVIATDAQARITFLNPAAEAMTGWALAEALGRPMAEVFRVIDEQTRQPVDDVAAEVLRLGTVVGLATHMALLARDGREIPIDNSGAPIMGDRGAITGVVVVFRDVTPRRQAEEAEVFRRTSDRLRLAMQSSNVGIWEVESPDGTFENRREHYINFLELLGHDTPQYPTDSTIWQGLVHPDDVERVDLAVRAFYFDKPRDYALELRIRHKDGFYRSIISRGTAICDEAGRLVRGVGTCIDITDLRRAEELLREAERRFRTFVDHAADAFFVHEDGTTRVLDVNRRACESLGYTRDELLRMTAHDFDPDMTPDRRAEVLQELDAGKTSAFESRNQRKDGTIFPVEVRLHPYRKDGRQFIVAVVRDITDRKQAEEALRENERMFRGTFENAAVGIDHVAFDGRVVRINKKFCEILGYTPEEMLTKTWMEFTHPDDLAADLDLFGQLLRGERTSYATEKRYIRKDGSIVWADLTVSVLRDADGRPAYCIAVVQDTSERKRLERALRESEEWFRFLANTMPQIVWTARPDGSPEYLNDRFVEYTGVPIAEITGDRWLSVLHPDDREKTMTRWMADVANGTDHDAEYRVRGADGRYRWFKTRGVPVRDESGQVIKWLGTATDIDDQKRAEEALRESEAWFRFLANEMPQIVWTARPDGSCDYLNQRCAEYMGIPVAELLEDGWLTHLHPDDREAAAAKWMAAVTSGVDHDVEWRLKGADGVYRWFKTRGLPVRDGSGQIVKWLGTSTDIDDQKRAAEAMRQARDAAEAINRAKDQFLANVSHEIRTPMNAILGMTELALDTPLSAEQHDYLAIVKSSAEALLKVINDLLDFAKIEAGKLKLDHADFSLRHVLGEALRALALRAHRKGLELACQIPPDVPDALIGDAGRLRQVLLNLIGNAIKFTEQGEVVVRIEPGLEHDPSLPGSRRSQVLQFAIRDTGIGIPRAQQEKIFRAFEQVDNSTTRRYEGTGLGLSIAASLAAMMGGQISVESEPGRGSIFRFTAEFGMQLDPPAQPAERPLVDLRGLRVLIVDDNATNRQIFEEWLRGWHTEPLAVADGFRALDALWSAVSVGQPFALVLLDSRLPGTDGLAVAERILHNPVLAPCRIILLTSEDLQGDFARYREMGIAASAMKPVQQEDLLEIIYRVMSRPDSAEPAVDRKDLAAAGTSTAADIPTRRLRVLVAEDHPFNQKLVEHLLRRRGHDVRIASDGREALAALEQDRFDLMLLDVHMPGYDGLQVIAALRSREQAEGGHLPVIALTARATSGDRERCLQAGMDDYLAKPFAAADLVRVMDRVLAGKPADEPVPDGRARAETLLAPVTLLAACDNDSTLLRELVEVFQSDTPDALTRIREALHKGDASRLREEAHRLRGLLSTFSAMAAAESLRLESMGASGQLDDAAATFDRLTEIVDRLGPQLEELSIEQLRDRAATGQPV